MRSPAAAILLCSLLLLAGCQTASPPAPTITQQQWEAIETREVDGQRDDVLLAASCVVLDEGFFYFASDHAAGLLTAARVPWNAENAFRRNGGMKGWYQAEVLSIWVRQVTPTRTAVRVQCVYLGTRLADEAKVTAFWTAVQRRMLATPVAGGAK